jgi:hypothetical protein
MGKFYNELRDSRALFCFEGGLAGSEFLSTLPDRALTNCIAVPAGLLLSLMMLMG